MVSTSSPQVVKGGEYENQCAEVSLRAGRVMTQRQCPECNSELVLARRPDNQHGAGMVAGPSTFWRCSTCGHGFTAEQIRDNKRAKSAAIKTA